MFLFSDAKEMKIKRDFFGSASPDSSGDGKSGSSFLMNWKIIKLSQFRD